MATEGGAAVTGLDVLVEAWTRWDRWPGDGPSARAKAAAIRALGLDANLLHDRVAELRRAGESTETALRTAVEEQEVEQ